jgi:hypothetical protein
VDDLLDKTESGRDQRLRCDDLDGLSVKSEIFRRDYYRRKNGEDKHDPKYFRNKRPSLTK